MTGVTFDAASLARSRARSVSEAVASATPLSGNGYKVQLAQTAVKRALLRAVNLETGGF